MENKQPIRPSAFFYILSLLIGLVGISVFLIILFFGIKNSTSGFQRFQAPGSFEMKLSEPGVFTVYYEYQSVFKGRVYDAGEDLPGLSLQVWDNDAGNVIPVRETSTRNTYSFGGRKGRSVFQFHAPHAGIFTLTGSYLDNQEGPEVILSVGKGFGVRLTLTIFAAIGTLFVSVVLSLVLVIVVFLKRDKYKRKLKEEGIPFNP